MSWNSLETEDTRITSFGDKKLKMYILSSCGMSFQKLKFSRLGNGFSDISGRGLESGFEVRTSIGTETEVTSLASSDRYLELASKYDCWLLGEPGVVGAVEKPLDRV